MKTTRTLRMTGEDCLICKAFLTFMFTPLVLLTLVGASLALSAYVAE